ncbi:MAG: c-type cytochrome biogenesis protein CcmI [Alphaproteobacteria bacterium]|jgi:cytochrome c-type biogenesis protein CcmH|nr:c-type cytochrome biogenesis protein CcmI [Alphaproteobacteria bacterium]
MLFWIVAAALTAACVALLVKPLMRRAEKGGTVESPNAHEAHMAAYRAQLEELERDEAAGLVDPERAEALRTEISRRLLAAGTPTPADSTTAPAAAPARRRPILALLLVIAIPLTALGLYIAGGSPGIPSRPLADRDPAERQAYEALVAEVDRLSRAAREDPENAEAQARLGDAFMQLQRYAEAAEAYGRAVGLTGGDPALTSAYGEALVSADNGTVTAQARAAFERVLDARPGDPRARYYLGLARAQAGDDEGALERWAALVADSPADAPWLSMVRRQAEAAAERLGRDVAAALPDPLPAAGPAGGPSRADMDAAAGMSEDDRAAMVRGMVEGLAARLETNPDDLQGWQRLAQSYAVLGENRLAAEAYARAAALSPDDPRLLSVYADAILATANPEAGAEAGQTLPPELAPVLERLLALDPGNPRALWFLGLDAATDGRAGEARDYWSTLRAQLDPGTPEHDALTRQIQRLQ